MIEFQLIDNDKDLNDACEQISQADVIALDTEFVRDYNYLPRLGLIQIAASNKIYLIDPITCNLDPIFSIFTNEKILKVMHSAGQDCDVLYKNFQIIPKPIFDTQIAGSIVGIGDNISYQKLVKRFSHKTLNKDTKLTNWIARPLDPNQLNYAANDVKYLCSIKIKLNGMITDSDRSSLMIEETETLYNSAQYSNIHLNAWQKISTVNQRPYFLNYLRQYAAIRERICQEQDKLKRHVISDDLLSELAKLQPSCEHDIKQHRLLAYKLNKKLWPEILAVSEQIKADQETEIPSKKSYILNNSQEVIYNFLKLLLQDAAVKNSISPRIIATTIELKKFIKTGEDTNFMHGKRYEIFGKQAQDLMDGKLSFSIKDGELKITKLENN
ncbi:MAG: ribonuclease D [Rickettsiales bacterium]|jgi:ribonuclease D|nr:ribonuclease D [Rickettsiales bacterium]